MLPRLARWQSALARQFRHLLGAALIAAPAGSALAAWNTTAETLHEHPTWIFTPPHAMANGKHALLIVLHGCDQTHTQLRNFGNLVPTAERHGIVLAVPDVGAEFFGPRCWDYNLANDAKGHIIELGRLANTLRNRDSLNIDPNHVYVVGLSSGAAMALAVGCRAPDVFAGIGAVAGPSVGSSQQLHATVDAAIIPGDNVQDAIAKCRALAGTAAPHFATQIASIAFGDMDRNGDRARFDFSLINPSQNAAHTGQIRLVSTRWSRDNIAILRSIYGTGDLGPRQPVQGGLGTQQIATANNVPRLTLLEVHNVGHAWPAGTGTPNHAQGGFWIAQDSLNYPEYVASWLITNNLRAPGQSGLPQVTLSVSESQTGINLSGTATDPDGSIERIETALLQADAAGTFQPRDTHNSIPLGPGGSYSDRYDNLQRGWYKVRVVARDNAGNPTEQISQNIPIGSPDPLTPCQEFTDSNFGHVQRGRAELCGFGFTCARGSRENLGLFNTFITTTLIEERAGHFRRGVCTLR